MKRHDGLHDIVFLNDGKKESDPDDATAFFDAPAPIFDDWKEGQVRAT